jgi:hypothetical protein
MWAADHDLWTPNLISESVSCLIGDPAAVLAFAPTILVDEKGIPHGLMASTPSSLSEPSALARYLRLIWELTAGNMIYGLIRRSALERASLGIPLIGPDHLVLAELALQGRFREVAGANFFRREYRGVESESQLLARRLADLAISSADYRALRNSHLRAVAHSDELRVFEKVIALVDTVRCFWVRFGVRRV